MRILIASGLLCYMLSGTSLQAQDEGSADLGRVNFSFRVQQHGEDWNVGLRSPANKTLDPGGGAKVAPDSARAASANIDADSPSRFSSGASSTLRVEIPKQTVQWGALMTDSLMFLGVMHTFRLATESGTRDGLSNSLVGGYLQSLGAMHGWSDGDGPFENYLGHPIQGAVSGYIWIHNDPRYHHVEFGRSRDYWISRLRAYAFAWAFSEQFEIGPLSEASVGQIQRYCCSYGFVDHVITPNGGLAWIVAGDTVDKYVVRRIEDHTKNKFIRIVARGGLNPPLTFANLMAFQAPWHRENREGVRSYDGDLNSRPVETGSQKFDHPVTPQFEVSASVPFAARFGNLSCIGGGGIGGFRIAPSWQWTIEVSGCTLAPSLPKYWSGDSLTFSTGPQWIRHSTSRWTPRVHFRVGGQKITEEYSDPVLKQKVLSTLPPTKSRNSVYYDYVRHYETTGLSLSVGGGIDLRLNSALAMQIGSVDYVRSWLEKLNGTDFTQGVRFSTGLVLRIGTW